MDLATGVSSVFPSGGADTFSEVVIGDIIDGTGWTLLQDASLNLERFLLSARKGIYSRKDLSNRRAVKVWYRSHELVSTGAASYISQTYMLSGAIVAALGTNPLTNLNCVWMTTVWTSGIGLITQSSTKNRDEYQKDANTYHYSGGVCPLWNQPAYTVWANCYVIEDVSTGYAMVPKAIPSGKVMVDMFLVSIGDLI